MDESLIEFVVPAIPVAQPRPRATAIAGRARLFEAAKTHPVHAFKATVRLAAERVYRGAPLAGPLWAELEFTFPRPASLRWKTRPMPRAPHGKKPDLDNCVKAVFDALNGLLFADDAQIMRVAAVKWIAAGEEMPQVWVRIRQAP